MQATIDTRQLVLDRAAGLGHRLGGWRPVEGGSRTTCTDCGCVAIIDARTGSAFGAVLREPCSVLRRVHFPGLAEHLAREMSRRLRRVMETADPSALRCLYLLDEVCALVIDRTATAEQTKTETLVFLLRRAGEEMVGDETVKAIYEALGILVWTAPNWHRDAPEIAHRDYQRAAQLIADLGPEPILA